MIKFIPKDIPEDAWIKIPPNKLFAIRLRKQEQGYFRLGGALGLYLSVETIKTGRALNTINYEEGEVSLITHLKPETPLVMGRTSDCDVKIMHAIVSRQHAQVEMMGDILTIMDVGSTNGTFLYKDQVYFDVDDFAAQKKAHGDKVPKYAWVEEEFGPEIQEFINDRLARIK